MDVRRYEELKEKVEGLRREAAKAEGQYETFMAKMKKDYDVETLDEAERYVINVGSVGQPRDGDPRLSFGIYEVEGRELTIYREEYPVAVAAEKILKAGLPEMLSTRLHLGV